MPYIRFGGSRSKNHAAASTIAGLITVQVFNLPWRFETTLLLYGILGGTLLALVTGLWATRRVTEAPPNETLRTL